MMTKQEFEERAGQDVTEEEYIIIEAVYMDYPAFTDIDKDVFADTYKIIGMVGIMDLYPRAQKISDLNKEISLLASRREDLKSNR